MPFEITQDSNAHRDENNHIRSFDHSFEPFETEDTDLQESFSSQQVEEITYRQLAEEYLRTVSNYLEFDNEMVSDFTHEETNSLQLDTGSRIAYVKEKQVANIATVAFEQIFMGLPVWHSAIAVQIDADNHRVIGSTNGAHYNIQLDPPDTGEMSFDPDNLTVDMLAELLGPGGEFEMPRINRMKLLIYQFNATARVLEHEDHDDREEKYSLDHEIPVLPLPPLDSNRFIDGTYYVVNEVLFTLVMNNREIHWTALIETVIGAVLYLRPHIGHLASVSGYVYSADPVTNGCDDCRGSSSSSTLDNLRTLQELNGLMPPVAGQKQTLEGEYVKIEDIAPPDIAPPTESPGIDFSFSVPTNDFSAVAAYYNVDYVFRLISELKIDVPTYFGGTTFPVPVDHRGQNNKVNASAEGNQNSDGLGSFLFGLAETNTTVGIAVTQRVVLHEFGHALLWNHVDSPNFGFAHSAGDSMAAILSDPNYMKSRSETDRFETFPFMKNSANLSRRHDRSVTQGWAWGGAHDDTGYASEQILSTTLFRVYRSLGGDSGMLPYQIFASLYVFYLIVKSIGMLTSMTWDATVYVDKLQIADKNTIDIRGQVGGTAYKIIRWSFEKQGLYQPANAPSPVSRPGSPPDVDVYIEDGRGGEYQWTDDYFSDYDIWNRYSGDGGLDHLYPRIGKENYLYVRVKNRGTQSAQNVTVQAFQQRAGTSGFDYPANWSALSPASINVSGDIPSNREAIVGPFSWTPQAGDTSILMIASASGDRSIVENPKLQGQTIPGWRLVPFDNNIACRKFTLE